MSVPQPRTSIRPPFRPRPRIVRRYEASVTGSYPIEEHAEDCPCRPCTRAARADLAAAQIDPPLPVVRLTFAAIVTANAVAFAWNPAGAWAALRAAVLHLLGAH